MSKQPGSSPTGEWRRSRPSAAELELSTDADAAAELDAGWDGQGSDENGFFEHGDDKTVPPIAADAAEEIQRPAPSSALSNRRAQIRKVVAGVVAGASLLAAFVVVKLIWTATTATARTDPSLTSLGTVIPSLDMTTQPSPVLGNELVAAKQDPAPAPAAEEQVAQEEHVDVAEKTAEPPAAEPAPAPAAPPAVRPAAPPPAPRTATKMDARRLLAAGRLQDAVNAARSALAADPADAESYILLGAALQDTGRWAEAMFVFASCVQNAKHGPLDDCRKLSKHY